MKDIQVIANLYESAALAACADAEQAGEEMPKLLSVHATVGGYVADFLAPRQAFMDIRKSIISAHGDYRVAFV